MILTNGIELHLGDCLDVLRSMPDGCVDAVVTDPPYPCIKREYGYWTEEEWFALMNPVVEECRRVLKPTGSAVFILQPNSDRVGRMRTWLWEFMAKWGKEWGIVQDAWWWNHTTLPMTGNSPSLLRPSLKACVWLGPSNCHRDASGVRWRESDGNAARRLSSRCIHQLAYRPSGASVRESRARGAAVANGGVTPFNVLPVAGRQPQAGSAMGHGASTPLALARWWIRYICPPGGITLDPFVGSGTMMLAAIQEGRRGIGIERLEEYHAIAKRRIEEVSIQPGLVYPVITRSGCQQKRRRK